VIASPRLIYLLVGLAAVSRVATALSSDLMLALMNVAAGLWIGKPHYIRACL
jgi:hypothetical protein